MDAESKKYALKKMQLFKGDITPMKIFTGLIFLWFTQSVYAWGFKNYDDCIIESAGNVATNGVAGLLMDACGNKYFDSAPDNIKIRVIENRIEDYKDSDPDFYNYYKKRINDEHFSGFTPRKIVENWVKSQGFPKR